MKRFKRRRTGLDGMHGRVMRPRGLSSYRINDIVRREAWAPVQNKTWFMVEVRVLPARKFLLEQCWEDLYGKR